MKRARCIAAAAAFALLPLAALAETQSPSISARDIGELCDRLASHPDDPQRVGDGVFLESIDVAAAEPACRKAVAIRPAEPRYLFELGRVLRQKEDFAAAIPLYEKAGSMGSAIALLGLGIFYEDGDGVTQDYDKAADYYRKAADAGLPTGLRYLGSLYEYGDVGDAADFPEAVRLYREAADRGDAVSLNRLGWLVQWGMGATRDEAAAEALYREAMASTNAEAIAEGKNNIAWMWALKDVNLADAERLAAEAVAETPTDDDWTVAAYLDTLAWVKHHAGRDAEALADEQRAIGLVDDNAPYYARLGDLYSATGDTGKAVAAWRKALELPAPERAYDPTWDGEAIRKKIAAAG